MDGCTAGTDCNSSPAASSCLHFASAALCGSSPGPLDAPRARLTPELLLEHVRASGAGSPISAAVDSVSETGSSGHPAPAARCKRRREEGAHARAADPAVQQWPAQRMRFPAGGDLTDCAQSAQAAPWAAEPGRGPAGSAWGGLWRTLESAAARPMYGRCPQWRAVLAAATLAGVPLVSAGSGSCASALGGGGGPPNKGSSFFVGAPPLEGPGMCSAVTAYVQVWPKPLCS